MQPPSTAVALALLVPLALEPAALAQQVTTVGPDGGFDALQQAYDAADPGDVLLLAPGVHGGLFADGKGVTLIGTGSSPDAVVIDSTPGLSAGSDPALWVRNVPADQSVRFVDLTVLGESSNEFGIEIWNCGGLVRLERVVVHADTHKGTWGGLQLGNDPQVWLEDVGVRVTPPGFFDEIGVPGLRAYATNLSDRGGSYVAGEGQSDQWSNPGADGIHASGSLLDLRDTRSFGSQQDLYMVWFVEEEEGAGLRVDDSRVWLGGGAHTLIRGADGLEDGFGSVAVTDGQSGAILLDGSELRRSHDVRVEAGDPGVLHMLSAPDVDATGGTDTVLDSILPGMALSSGLPAAGETVALELYGPANALAWTYVSLVSRPPVEIDGVEGLLWIDLVQAELVTTAQLDAAGRAAVDLTTPSNAVPLPTELLFQTVTLEGSEGLALSNPEALLLLP